MATEEDRLTKIVRECVRNEMALKRSESASNASLLSRTLNLISMRPDRWAILIWPKIPDMAARIGSGYLVFPKQTWRLGL